MESWFEYSQAIRVSLSEKVSLEQKLKGSDRVAVPQTSRGKSILGGGGKGLYKDLKVQIYLCN